MKKLAFIILLLMEFHSLMAQNWEKIGDRPQMGWNTWNKFAGNINEELVRGIADALVETGMRDAGYTYINLDDCWHGQRDAGPAHPGDHGPRHVGAVSHRLGRRRADLVLRSGKGRGHRDLER